MQVQNVIGFNCELTDLGARELDALLHDVKELLPLLMGTPWSPLCPFVSLCDGHGEVKASGVFLSGSILTKPKKGHWHCNKHKKINRKVSSKVREECRSQYTVIVLPNSQQDKTLLGRQPHIKVCVYVRIWLIRSVQVSPALYHHKPQAASPTDTPLIWLEGSELSKHTTWALRCCLLLMSSFNQEGDWKQARRVHLKAHPVLTEACRSAWNASSVFWASSQHLYIVPVKDGWNRNLVLNHSYRLICLKICICL